MGLLKEEDKKFLENMFKSDMLGKIKLKFFYTPNNESCELEKQIIDEVISLNPELFMLEEYSFNENTDKVKEYNIEYIPALIVTTEDETVGNNIIFYGVPSGHEFGSLIQTIVWVSNHDKQIIISDNILDQVNKINEVTKLTIFVTPSCPYCPRAVLTSVSLSLKNNNIKTEVVMANEIPELTNQFDVQSVPKIVVNRDPDKFFVGAYPLPQFVSQVIEFLEI